MYHEFQWSKVAGNIIQTHVILDPFIKEPVYSGQFQPEIVPKLFVLSSCEWFLSHIRKGKSNRTVIDQKFAHSQRWNNMHEKY